MIPEDRLLRDGFPLVETRKAALPFAKLAFVTRSGGKCLCYLGGRGRAYPVVSITCFIMSY